MSTRIAVKAEQKCCRVRGLFCSLRSRVPGCDPLTVRYAKTTPTGQTALSVLPIENFYSLSIWVGFLLFDMNLYDLWVSSAVNHHILVR